MESHRVEHSRFNDHVLEVANTRINSPQVTSQPATLLHLNHATDLMTSKHITSKHMTSQPWNGRSLVHTKKLAWASRWSVALRTFYRHFFWLYSFFSSETSAPGSPGNYLYIVVGSFTRQSHMLNWNVTSSLNVSVQRILSVIGLTSCSSHALCARFWWFTSC